MEQEGAKKLMELYAEKRFLDPLFVGPAENQKFYDFNF